MTTEYHGPIGGQIFEAGVLSLGAMVLALPVFLFLLWATRRMKWGWSKKIIFALFTLGVLYGAHSCIMLGRDL